MLVAKLREDVSKSFGQVMCWINTHFQTFSHCDQKIIVSLQQNTISFISNRPKQYKIMLETRKKKTTFSTFHLEDGKKENVDSCRAANQPIPKFFSGVHLELTVVLRCFNHPKVGKMFDPKNKLFPYLFIHQSSGSGSNPNYDNPIVTLEIIAKRRDKHYFNSGIDLKFNPFNVVNPIINRPHV